VAVCEDGGRGDVLAKEEKNMGTNNLISILVGVIIVIVLIYILLRLV
jgi:uncharacterized protein HemY